jgi:hypothetical protein
MSAYGCPSYDINRLCRYDRRGIDRFCDGCQRTTDKDYLEANGLWVVGVSHQLPVFLEKNGSIERLSA